MPNSLTLVADTSVKTSLKCTQSSDHGLGRNCTSHAAPTRVKHFFLNCCQLMTSIFDEGWKWDIESWKEEGKSGVFWSHGKSPMCGRMVIKISIEVTC